MDNQAAAKKQETMSHNLRVKTLLDKLKSKLNNFQVLDKNGLSIGIVKDIYLNKNRQIFLLISATDLPDSETFSMTSNQIQQVDYPQKAIFTTIEKLETQSMLTSAEIQPGREEFIEPSLPDGYITEESSSSPTTDVVEEEVIRLLEERLVINHQKRKIGEVIVRKEIETRMVEVPVQYEKLIVEQVGSESKIIAEVDLSQSEYNASTTNELTSTETSSNTVKGEFVSPKTASLLLDAIDKQKHHHCQLVRIEVVLENSENQALYQEWFDRCSGT